MDGLVFEDDISGGAVGFCGEVGSKAEGLSGKAGRVGAIQQNNGQGPAILLCVFNPCRSAFPTNL